MSFNIIKKIMKVIKDPKSVVNFLVTKGFFSWLKDDQYVMLSYYLRTGKKLNLEDPKSFNEKLQWLKLNDRKPEYSKLVDKYEVRDYISKTIGEKYLFPLYGVYNDFNSVDFDSLPNQFVLKCTHDSGGLVICKDKSQLDIKSAREKINKALKKNYYYHGREWPYKDVKPRIICEKYMVDESGTELKDYKIFCFNGEPKIIQVDFNRFINHKRNIYDSAWKYIDVSIKYPNDSSCEIKKPEKLDEMLNYARILSKNMPHVRVDFYSINEQIYFGEITFFHGSGYEKFCPERFELEMGSWIILPK